MEEKISIETAYNIWKSESNLINNSVIFNWEKQLPIGRGKCEHYAKGCKILTDLILTTVTAPIEDIALIVGPSFMPVLLLAPDFERISFGGTEAHKVGTLSNISVILDPAFGEDDKIIFDLIGNSAISISQGSYDYDMDLADLETTIVEEDK